MELRVLNYFLMAAREENITRAAKLLHITQPTLSRQLMQLEEELGVKLFQRSKHSIILTEEGMLLKRRAQELVSLADKTKQEFLQRDDQLAGEIAIGSGELNSVKFLSELLTSFRRKHPPVRYDIYSGNVDNIKERIERGITDLGLFMEPVDIDKYEFISMPFKEQWGVLTPIGSPLAAKQSVEPEDLLQVPVLLTNRALVQNRLANWFGSYFEKLDIVVTYNLIYNIAIMVQSGMGAAICLKLDCSYDGVCFVPFSSPIETGSVLAWKKNQTLSPLMAGFIEYAKKYPKCIGSDLL